MVGGCGKRSSDKNLTELDPVGASWFQDTTDAVGIDFVHDPGPVGEYEMPQEIGSGAALFDCNNDGRLDILFVQNAGPSSQARNRLFTQSDGGRFEDTSAGSGLDIAGHGMGVAVGDVNNDGWNDVFLTEDGMVRLFVNRMGRFHDVSIQAGIENTHWATSACFVDYDRDGWLDIFVTNYVEFSPDHKCYDKAGAIEFCGPSGFPPAISKLFRNLGSTANDRDAIRFQDVTVSSGIAKVPGPGLGVVCADFDGDRWPDIFCADDAEKNRLWINQQNGEFREEALERGIAYNAMGKPQADMGIALGDVNSDGMFDVFVTHLNTETHALWVQGPRGVFQDKTSVSGTARTKWRGTAFGTVFGDFNSDGSNDLALVNGSIKRQRGLPEREHLGPFWSPYAQRNQLLENNGDGTFTDRSNANLDFCGRYEVARGLACGDIDNDGALDLLVTNVGSRARLYRNVAPERGNWLMVRAVLPMCGGRDAYGAEITIESGYWRATRWLNPGYSFLCSNDPRCHFGLGNRERTERILVDWPDGTREEFPGCTANQVLTLQKGTGI